MMLKVLVCGAADYVDAEKVRSSLDRLARNHGALQVFDLGGPGAGAGARWYRVERGLSGGSAWHMTAVSDLSPDYVLCFGQDDQGIVNKARSAGVIVGEVL